MVKVVVHFHLIYFSLRAGSDFFQTLQTILLFDIPIENIETMILGNLGGSMRA